ncbi:MAG TPA: hypothetical protein DD738_08535 [Ruminiclostridium sp.]|jgi:hypothetical protein|nr:hypothetical protein [Ruminiclostridium sp.]
MKIDARVMQDKSFDPQFVVKVSYDDGKTRFMNELVSVVRRPPKVTFEYSETLKPILTKVDIQRIELEVMRVIVESLLNK